MLKISDIDENHRLRVRILGAGWYGCHLACVLIEEGHAVELFELAPKLFAGASGNNPARLHMGFHYPRSATTRAACWNDWLYFMQRYGDLTDSIATNIYAIADHDSLIDFGTYRKIFENTPVRAFEIERPRDFGLEGVEGAFMTGERRISIARARAYFREALGDRLALGTERTIAPGEDEDFDLLIDCTFCALDAERIDRYEPCVVGLLEAGPDGADTAVTIMDGPFPSIYPWSHSRGIVSISSARDTPVARCATYQEAKAKLDALESIEVGRIIEKMRAHMRMFWPASYDLFRPLDGMLSVRAMPRSRADARLVDVLRTGEKSIRIRAGKITAIFAAERKVKEIVGELSYERYTRRIFPHGRPGRRK